MIWSRGEREDNWVGITSITSPRWRSISSARRGAGLFLLSPLDWALIESWKNAGVPLAAVLRGIDTAFREMARAQVEEPDGEFTYYCAQAVLHRGADHGGFGPNCRPGRGCPPFPESDLRDYLAANAELARKAGFAEIGASLENLAAETGRHYQDLETTGAAIDGPRGEADRHVEEVRRARSIVAARRERTGSFVRTAGRCRRSSFPCSSGSIYDRRLLEGIRFCRG